MMMMMMKYEMWTVPIYEISANRRLYLQIFEELQNKIGLSIKVATIIPGNC